MQNLTKEQLKNVEEILKTKNDETRLIKLKQYLSTIKEQLSADFAHVAFQLWLKDGGSKKDK